MRAAQPVGSDIEPVCASLLYLLEKRPTSLRAVLEEARPRVPRRLLNATCLGVLRNYKLVERMLRTCGYEPPARGSRNYWLKIVGGYEAVFRKQVVSISRVVQKTGLPHSTATCLRRLSPEEAVRGIRDRVRRLAVLYSLPRWVVEEFMRLDPPGGVEALLSSLQRPSPLWLRVNTRRLARGEALRLLRERGIAAEPDPLLHDMVMVEEAAPDAMEELDRSIFYPEDRAPAAAVHMLNRSMGRGAARLLDLFSAPGNKAAHLAWLRPGLLFYSVELSPRRLVAEKKLHAEEEVGLQGVYVLALAEQPPFRREAFDAAIVDPDCTSLGRLGHSPETRLFLEKVGRAILRRARAVQEAGLLAAASHVRRGGVVLYTTCTLTLEENEGVVEKLVGEGVFEPVESGVEVGVAGRVRGSRRFYPHLTRSTGGFAVTLRRL